MSADCGAGRSRSELLEPFHGFNPKRSPKTRKPGWRVEEVIDRAQAILKYKDLGQHYSIATAAEWMMRLTRVEHGDPPDGTGRFAELRSCIDRYDLSSDPEAIDAKPWEVFAVLALQLVGLGLHHMNDLHEAYGAFLEALDATCYAERLRDNERQLKAFRIIEQGLKVEHQYRQTLVAALDRKVDEAVEKKLSLKSRELNHKSHESHRQNAIDALRLYDENVERLCDLSLDEAAAEIRKLPPFCSQCKKPELSTIKNYLRPRRAELGHAKVGAPRKKK